jgi:hypothetical protein
MVIRVFIERLMGLGILPTVEDFKIVWPDLSTPSDKDKAEVAKLKTEAMAKYVQAEVDGLIAPKQYLMMVLGFSEEEAEAIEKDALAHVEEMDDSEEERQRQQEDEDRAQQRAIEIEQIRRNEKKNGKKF